MKTLMMIALAAGLLVGQTAGAVDSGRRLVPAKVATGKLATADIGVEAVHCALEDGLSTEKGRFSFGLSDGVGTATSAQ